MNIRLENVSKKFKSRRGIVDAVKTVSLQVEDGEFFVLLGPSGCGKSTILNLVAGLEKPTSGEVYFDKTLVASPAKRVFKSPRDRNVSMVFQSYALYPHLNVYNNIAFPLSVAKQPRDDIRRAVEEAADLVEIRNLLSARPGELSGGQKQRVAIARAVVRRPDVLLLDEPLSNLDAQLRASTRTELKKLQRRLGLTTVYVTHDQLEAMTLGHRVAVILEGNVVQRGTPAQLYERPATTFVARFVGSPPMTLVQAEVAPHGKHLLVHIGDQKFPAEGALLDQLKDFGTGPVTLGIRPEHVVLNPDWADVRLQGAIDTIEPQGRENLVGISFAGKVLHTVTQARGLNHSDQVVAGFQLADVHVFN